jgi:hypothetical protein
LHPWGSELFCSLYAYEMHSDFSITELFWFWSSSHPDGYVALYPEGSEFVLWFSCMILMLYCHHGSSICFKAPQTP